MLNQNVPYNVNIIAAGIGKIFVGELTEMAKDVMNDWGDDENSAIRPDHLREAYRRYRIREGKIKSNSFIYKKQLFK